MNRFSEIWEKSDSEVLMSIAGIKALLKSPDYAERLRSLFHMRRVLNESGLNDHIFRLAQGTINDPNNDCRWQSLIIIGSFIEKEPYEIWKIILKYGSSTDEDMQTAISTLLLEHFFEVHPQLFENLFPEITRVVIQGNKNLLNCLSLCRSDFGSKLNKRVVDKFINSHS